MSLPNDFRQRFLNELRNRGVSNNCELCNQNNWAFVNEGVALNITDFSTNVRIPQPNIPSVAMICNNCGNIRLFSLGALNLLPIQGGTDNG